MLALYWLAITFVAVGGWQTRLVRARRIRLAKNKSTALATENGGSIVNKAVLDLVETRNIRGNRRMHVALDLRRKFFHALAVIMFVPAIAIDVRDRVTIDGFYILTMPFAVPQPAFASLAFAVAFAIFTFAEYARYFAVYPIGAPIHMFFSEFVDSKDAGPVILSHFYLLTGCAGGLWLEGRGVKMFTGVLAVGIGDALVSCAMLVIVAIALLNMCQISLAGIYSRKEAWSHEMAKHKQNIAGDHVIHFIHLLGGNNASHRRPGAVIFSKKHIVSLVWICLAET